MSTDQQPKTRAELEALSRATGIPYVSALPDCSGADVSALTGYPAAARRGPGPAYAATTGSRPAAVMEPMPREITGGSGNGIEVDAYSLNPGRDYYGKLMPGAQFELPTPTMFATGDLPPFTAAPGVPVEALRLVRWQLRHSAAYTKDAAAVLRMIDEGDQEDARELQTGQGQAAASAYWSRVAEWVLSRPEDDPISDQELESLHAPGTIHPPKPPAKSGVGRSGNRYPH